MNAHLIDGEERPSEKGGTFTTINPATGEELDTVALGGEADVNAAVDAATRAATSGVGYPLRNARPCCAASPA
ncbi:aldehyde dehydrogenase family protein [Nonomuraea thailandensis]